MRAALLPHPADPFLFNYWLKFFNNVWGKEVDKLYILINSPMEKEVIAYMLSLVAGNDKIDCDYVDKQMEHGDALNILLEKCQEEYVMLIEDDGFIFKPSVVDACFKKLETNEFDIVASPRGSCSQEIWDRAKEIWGLDYSGRGDVGPNFWPNFFFTKKEILINTDRNFKARAWLRGERIEPLDYVVQDEVCPGDTFVNTSLQLRSKGYRIGEIPQYHGSPDDLDDYNRQYNLFDGVAPWVHVGSLSSGTHGVLMDDYGRKLAKRFIEPARDPIIAGQCNSEQERREWERRVTMWSIFLDNAEPEAIKEFQELYRGAIQRIIKQFSLRQDLIDTRKAIYHTLGL